MTRRREGRETPRVPSAATREPSPLDRRRARSKRRRWEGNEQEEKEDEEDARRDDGVGDRRRVASCLDLNVLISSFSLGVLQT